jgi:hypothetical protein
MKNTKMFLGGMLALALTFGMVLLGCSPTEVEGAVGIDNGKAAEVATPTIAATTDNRYFILSWDAAGPDLSYDVYFAQDEKVSSVYATGGQNALVYAPADGELSPNSDLDKYSVRIDSNAIWGLIKVPGAVKLGVRSKSTLTGTGATLSSDIAWADPVTLTTTPLTTVTVANGTPSDYTIDVTLPADPTGIEYSYYYEAYNQFGSQIKSGYLSAGVTSLYDTDFYVGAKVTFFVNISGAQHPSTYAPIYDVYSLWDTKVKSAQLTVN